MDEKRKHIFYKSKKRFEEAVRERERERDEDEDDEPGELSKISAHNL